MEKPKRHFLEDNMRKPVRQVLVGEGAVQLSLRKATKQNDVSFQTLQRYVKKKKSKAHPNDQVSMNSNYKRRLVFSENEEN
jgi:hypothetical protein